MSRKDSTGSRRRAAFGLATAAGGAVAAMLSMGIAHADTPITDVYPAPDPYDVLFGAEGGLTANSQGADNAILDTELFESNPSGYAAFSTAVDAFEANPAEHGIEN
jgi:hypothetical protein